MARFRKNLINVELRYRRVARLSPQKKRGGKTFAWAGGKSGHIVLTVQRDGEKVVESRGFKA